MNLVASGTRGGSTRFHISKMGALLFVLLLALASLCCNVEVQASPDLTLENSAAWMDNNSVASVAVGDVDADGGKEIVTEGYYHDGTRDVAQLAVSNGTNLTLEDIASWYWTGDTRIESVAVGNVDADGEVEIVTGGNYYDGTRWVAQLAVFNGTTLALEDVATWYWTGDTYIVSVAVGDVEPDAQMEIVTGGLYDGGTHGCAQLLVWAVS